jgi:hypothetical protein
MKSLYLSVLISALVLGCGGVEDSQVSENKQNSPAQKEVYMADQLDLSAPTSTIETCGVGLTVSGLAAWACSATLAAIPPVCIATAVPTGGTICAVNIGLAAAACGASVAVITKIALACIEQASGE